MIRTVFFAALLGIPTAGAALAQTAWAETNSQVMVPGLGMSADAIDDMDVVDAGGRKIGEVDGVVGPVRTEAAAIVVDLDSTSGLLPDDRDIVVPLAGVEMQGKALRLLGDAATLRGYEIYQD